MFNMEGMEIKAVIFDLDGTLIDTIEDIAEANNMMLNDFGFPIHTISEYIRWIGNGARILVEASLPPEVRGEDIGIYLTKYEQYYRSNIDVKSKLFPQMDELLDRLTNAGIPMAIITNKPQSLTDTIINIYFKRWTFANVIGHTNHFPHKPDSAGALHFAKQINTTPENILFVGDSVVDIQTAKAAGMIPMGVNWGYGNPELEGNNITLVDQPQEIIDYLNVEAVI